ncbi:unnamed protein product [Fusarium graminearum]|uniref:Apple domain-containing protein n=1 Tax=Gibberella zeae TaxID=5518 RepID=A0A4E9DW99_GIBZA|nr:unnamed protein product [Fusarium graminearum]
MTANPTSSETEGPLIVKNKIAGGNFATRGTVGNPVPGFSVEGEAQILLNKGYTGDGSKEQGCVELSATGSPAGRKRAVGNAVRISQQVSDLNTKNKYTVRFFYAAITTISVNMCDISASIGNLELYMSNIISSRQVIQWATILTQTDVPHTEGTFLLSFTCPIGGIAIIYVDSIFMSNQVTPDNIDDVATNFGNEGGVPTPRTTTSPATASPTTETPNIQVTTGKPSTMDAPSSAAYDPTSDADQTASAYQISSQMVHRLCQCLPLKTCPQEQRMIFELGPADENSQPDAPRACWAYGVPKVGTWGRAKWSNPRQNSMADCALLCKQEGTSCKAFALNTLGQETFCLMLGDRLGVAGIDLDKQRSLIWNDFDCFECQGC